MMEMNNAKHEEIRDFLEWLERAIRTEIDTLKRKTQLRKYYNLEFGEFSSILEENRRNIPINPTNREFLSDLRREFERSIEILSPLRASLKATGMLIDEIVYRLYGLTANEIKIMKQSV